jgi:PTB domain-containing engulfment adapter protein 1
LTIGQAFELAYKKYLETSGKDMETKKQLLVLQKRIALLENENTELKKRLKDVADIKGGQDVTDYMSKNNVSIIS